MNQIVENEENQELQPEVKLEILEKSQESANEITKVTAVSTIKKDMKNKLLGQKSSGEIVKNLKKLNEINYYISLN
jgi:hypothetical protein